MVNEGQYEKAELPTEVTPSAVTVVSDEKFEKQYSSIVVTEFPSVTVLRVLRESLKQSCSSFLIAVPVVLKLSIL